MRHFSPKLAGLVLLCCAALHLRICSAQAPYLGIQELPGQQVLLFWPQATTSNVLETTSSLGDPTAWGAVTGTPVLQGANWALTIPTTGSSAFFRLRVAQTIIQTVESATVSYLNALPETIPAGTVITRDSQLVSFLNALPAIVPAGTTETLASVSVSYLNALPGTVTAGTVEQLASPPVSYLNATAQTLPGGTLTTVVSPIVSYWNQ